MNDYSKVSGVSAEDFEREAIKLEQIVRHGGRNATPAEIAATERLLQVRAGVLAAGQYWFDAAKCETCSRDLGLYDFALTAMLDAGHSRSFILHTLLGTKHILNPPRPLRCSNCGHSTRFDVFYICMSYACSGGSTGRHVSDKAHGG